MDNCKHSYYYYEGCFLSEVLLDKDGSQSGAYHVIYLLHHMTCHVILYSVGTQCELEIVLLGNHVQVNNEQKASSTVTEELV